MDKLFVIGLDGLKAGRSHFTWHADGKFFGDFENSEILDADLDVDAEKFCDDLLDQKGVLVCHGNCFNIPHTFRITLSHAHELETGLALINEYIDELVAAGHALK